MTIPAAVNRREKPSLPISGLWTRTGPNGEWETLIEVSGDWYLVHREPYVERNAIVSHIVEPLGMLLAIARGPERFDDDQEKSS